MADTKAKSYADINYVTDRAIPLDCRGRQAWGTWETFPEGEYAFRLRGFGGTVTKNGNQAVMVKLETLHGPDDTDNMKGSVYYNQFVLANDANKNFFYGFLYQLCPEGLKPDNLTKGPKGEPIPKMAWWTGGGDGSGGCVFKGRMEKGDSYVDDAGKTREPVRLGTVVRLIRPSVFAMHQGVEAPAGAEQVVEKAAEVKGNGQNDMDSFFGGPAD